MGYDKRVRPNYGGKFSIYFSNAQLGTNMGLVRNKRPQFGQLEIKSYHTNHVKARHNFCSWEKQFPTQTIWPLSFSSIPGISFHVSRWKESGFCPQNESLDRNRKKRKELTVGRTPREEKSADQPTMHCSFLGTAVTVGVTMFVLSISELSEVGMVRKKKYFTLLITHW